MYLTRITLNTKRRETMNALSSPQMLHGAIESSFSGDRQRNLWRIDWLDNTCYLLVLSTEKAAFSKVVDQFGYPDLERRWETKNYDLLLSRLNQGQVWQFRLCANPVHSSFKEKDQKSGRGKVFAHVTQEQQRQWLIKKSESCGFSLDEDEFDIVNTQWLKFNKGVTGNHKVTLRTATFEGLLTITNIERFKETIVSGIGRSKAYGCGLLTIANRKSESNG